MKAKNKKTGEIVKIIIVDFIYNGKPFYEYYIDKYDLLYTPKQISELYEIIQDNYKVIETGNDKMSIAYVVPNEDPNHPYGGMEDNVPVTEESSTTETWRDRINNHMEDFKTIDKSDAIEIFQQELERIKNNFMTEFTDPDTGMLNIGKYDHERIINFFNKEIK